MADLFSGLLDETIGRIPGASDSGIWKQIRNITVLPVKLVEDMTVMTLNMTKSMMTLGTSMQNALGKVANGLADSLNSPLLMYGVVGGLALGGIYIIEGGGSGGGGYSNLPSNAQTLSALASFTPMGKVARLI